MCTRYRPLSFYGVLSLSIGPTQACELRDGGSRYLGKGVLKAVEAVNKTLAPALIGKDPTAQRELDDLMIAMDDTPNKTNLGANAILACSIAAAHAGAGAKKLPLFMHIGELAGNPDPNLLPIPCFNVINGGEHAGNKLAFQAPDVYISHPLTKFTSHTAHISR